MPVVDLASQRFGRLVVTKRAGTNSSGEATWLCACDCGASHVARGLYLRRGVTKSCGCLRRDIARKMLTESRFSRKHGHGAVGRLTPTYRSWRAMIQRCNYRCQPNYANYGGRGIRVCDRWLKFENFLADMGERPDGLTLDRIDNERGYSKDNCRWATRAQQDSNRRKRRRV